MEENNPTLLLQSQINKGFALNLPATEFGRGIAREEVLFTLCCGRGLLGAGGVLDSVTSVLDRVSFSWTVRVSLFGPVWCSPLTCPITPVPPTGPSSFISTSLVVLRSSFSEELVVVAGPCRRKLKQWRERKKKRKNQTVYFLENTSTVDMTIVTNKWRLRPVLFWIGPDAGLVSLEIQALFFLKK